MMNGKRMKRMKWMALALVSSRVALTIVAAETMATAALAGESLLPTMENKAQPPGPAPDGMVWVPGGEFSMGSDASNEGLCGLPGVTHDAQPIHRVYVDGFRCVKSASPTGEKTP